MPFSIVAAPIYISTNSVLRFPYLHILTNTCYLRGFVFFCNSHPNRYEVTSRAFDLHSLKIDDVENLFTYLLAISVTSNTIDWFHWVLCFI